jgi:hypothetical protein
MRHSEREISEARGLEIGRSLRPLVLISAACAGLVFALSLLSPLLPSFSPLIVYFIAFSVITAMTLSAALVAPSLGGRSLVVSVLLAIGVLTGVVLAGEVMPQRLAAVVVTFALLAGGAMVGGAVGGRIEHPGHLLAVVVVSLIVDSFSVFHSAGPTAAVVERPQLIAVLALPFPVLGTELIAPVLGVGDVVFAALYMTASRRFSLGSLRTALAIAAGLLLTMAGVALLQLPLPALVGMGVAVLVVHPRARRLPRKDRLKAGIIMGGLLVLWLVLFLRDR